MRTQTRWPSSHTLLHWPRQPHSSCSFGPFITSPLSPHSSLRHRHGVSKHLMEFSAVVGFLMFYSEPLTVHSSPQHGGTHGEWKENACIRNMNGVCSVYSAFILRGPEWWHLSALDGRGISLILFDLRADMSDSSLVLLYFALSLKR